MQRRRPPGRQVRPAAPPGPGSRSAARPAAPHAEVVAEPVPGHAGRPRRRRHRRGRQAGRRRRPPQPGLDRARPWSAGWPRPATGSPRPGAAERQGVVHRLDVGTSGLMVVAKSERAYSRLKQAFRERTVDKVYHALVQGHPDPLARHHRRPDRPPPHRTTTSGPWSPAASRASPTTRCSRRSAAASLLEVHLETGRTHQIRVHLSALRHPCVGDLTYGADPVLAAAARADPAVAARRAAGLRAPRHRRAGGVHQPLPGRPGPGPGGAGGG